MRTVKGDLAHVYLDEGDKEKYKQMAANMGMSFSQLVREALANYAANEKRIY